MTDASDYETNRGRVQAALILCEEYLHASEVTFLQEYIDHDEFGLALDEMVAVLSDRDVRLPDGTVAELESMLPIMYPGKNAESQLTKLRRLSASASAGPTSSTS